MSVWNFKLMLHHSSSCLVAENITAWLRNLNSVTVIYMYVSALLQFTCQGDDSGSRGASGMYGYSHRNISNRYKLLEVNYQHSRII